MNFLKKSLLTLGAAIISMTFVYGGYSLYAGTYDFQDSNLYFAEVIESYHGGMNDLFNEKISALNELIDSDDFYTNSEKKSLLVPPQNLDKFHASIEEITEACGDKNLSSYCLSMQSLKMYLAYVETLTELKDKLENPGFIRDARLVLSITQARNEKVDKEIVNSKKVMEGAIAAYAEYQLAAPMHKKNEEVLKALVQYKLVLKDIRTRTAKFPLKFIDSSTDECS